MTDVRDHHSVKRLAIAVIEKAMRDAQLVECGHRVLVCTLDKWSGQQQRIIVTARDWLTRDSQILEFWCTCTAIDRTDLSQHIKPRREWTEQLEAEASPDTPAPIRYQRWPSPKWPFRRVGDDRRENYGD
jgi:hypothetical protein